MRKRANRNAILNDWEQGMSSAELAEAYSVCRGHVCNIILRARDVGDPRAVKRNRGPRKKVKSIT
jgi:Mor family transcriptional regulator